MTTKANNTTDVIIKNTIRVGGSTALYTAYTVYAVYTVDTVYIVDTVYTVNTIQTDLHSLNSSMHCMHA